MTFEKQPVIPGLGKDGSRWNSCIILVEMQSGMAILKSSLTISYKVYIHLHVIHLFCSLDKCKLKFIQKPENTVCSNIINS